MMCGHSRPNLLMPSHNNNKQSIRSRSEITLEIRFFFFFLVLRQHRADLPMYIECGIYLSGLPKTDISKPWRADVTDAFAVFKCLKLPTSSHARHTDVNSAKHATAMIFIDDIFRHARNNYFVTPPRLCCCIV